MPRCDLSILCVTKAEPHSFPFVLAMRELAADLGAEFVPVADGAMAAGRLVDHAMRGPRYVESKGYIESVLDEALEFCTRDYVLRLDDDERCSKSMVRWLTSRGYETSNHWKLPRIHLWGDEHHALVTPHLYPDHQTRLSVKKLAGSRPGIHSGSPHGGGLEAPGVIEHAKFLVKSLDERREIVERYESIQEGAGSQFRPFSCPEDFYSAAEITASVRTWDGETFGKIAA